MRRLDKPYKFFLKRHYLALKRVLIIIFVLEIVLIGREVLFKDTKNTEANIQQEAVSDVLGEKSESEAVEDQKTAPVSLTPTTKPEIKESGGAGKSTTTSVSSPNPITPTADVKKHPNYADSGYFRYLKQPFLKEYNGKNVNVNKGTIKFKVTPDWGENLEYNHKTLVLVNFNGEDYRNLFEIAGSEGDLTFDTYDNAAFNGADEPNYFMGHDYIGKTYDVKFRWDFTGDPVKQIFINGVLAVETRPEAKPTETNGKIYVGPVTDLEISDEWEE